MGGHQAARYGVIPAISRTKVLGDADLTLDAGGRYSPGRLARCFSSSITWTSHAA
jgi:hypothetical protein